MNSCSMPGLRSTPFATPIMRIWCRPRSAMTLREAREERLHLRRSIQLVGDDAPRERLGGVVLRKEGLEDGVGVRAGCVLRKEAAIAQVPAAAHHRERHAPHALALDHDHDVDI